MYISQLEEYRQVNFNVSFNSDSVLRIVPNSLVEIYKTLIFNLLEFVNHGKNSAQYYNDESYDDLVATVYKEVRAHFFLLKLLRWRVGVVFKEE